MWVYRCIHRLALTFYEYNHSIVGYFYFSNLHGTQTTSWINAHQCMIFLTWLLSNWINTLCETTIRVIFVAFIHLIITTVLQKVSSFCIACTPNNRHLFSKAYCTLRNMWNVMIKRFHHSAVTLDLQELDTNRGPLKYLSFWLRIYSAPDCSDVRSVQCCLWCYTLKKKGEVTRSE